MLFRGVQRHFCSDFGTRNRLFKGPHCQPPDSHDLNPQEKEFNRSTVHKLSRYFVAICFLLTLLAAPLSHADGGNPPPQCTPGSHTCGGR